MMFPCFSSCEQQRYNRSRFRSGMTTLLLTRLGDRLPIMYQFPHVNNSERIIPAPIVTCNCVCVCCVQFVSSEFEQCILCSTGKHLRPPEGKPIIAQAA